MVSEEDAKAAAIGLNNLVLGSRPISVHQVYHLVCILLLIRDLPPSLPTHSLSLSLSLSLVSLSLVALSISSLVSALSRQTSYTLQLHQPSLGWILSLGWGHHQPLSSVVSLMILLFQTWSSFSLIMMWGTTIDSGIACYCYSLEFWCVLCNNYDTSSFFFSA